MDIVQIITICLGYAISIALFIKGVFDTIKKKKLTTQTGTLVDENAKLEVLSKVAEFCAEAEAVVGKGNGPIKELFVTCRVDKLASEKNVIVTQDEIKAEIEKCLTCPQKKK